jgi:hypothetical protein
MVKAVRPISTEPKKPYSAPRVIVYGTVRDLTQKVGIHGKGDAGTRIGHKKTAV